MIIMIKVYVLFAFAWSTICLLPVYLCADYVLIDQICRVYCGD